MIIRDLPLPPEGKEGWPWNVLDQPDCTSQKEDFIPPKVSIVTPSYNQGVYIEETIRSILLQGYPNLEYIIIDGGSTDGTVEIIKKYEKYLAYWVSEPDKGQTHALNKGLQKVTGDIFTFINSDDMLAANALYQVADYFRSQPSTWVLSGGLTQVDQLGNFIQSFQPHSKLSWQDIVLGKAYQLQPCTFWRTLVFQQVGIFREDLHYFFDQEFFIRLLMNYSIEPVEEILAYARIHQYAKTQSSSLTWSHEMFAERVKLLSLAESNFLKRFLAYRSLRLNFLTPRLSGKAFSFVDRLKILVYNPILLTSGLGLGVVLGK